MYLPFTYSSLLHFCLDIIWCWFSTHTYQYCTVIGFCYLLCGLSTASINQCYGFSTSFELISKFFYSSFNVTLKPKKNTFMRNIYLDEKIFVYRLFSYTRVFAVSGLCFGYIVHTYVHTIWQGWPYIYIYIYIYILQDHWLSETIYMHYFSYWWLT